MGLLVQRVRVVQQMRGGLQGHLVAITAVAGAWFVATSRVVFGHLRDEEAASRVVNVAGRQRMLTQRMARYALALEQDEHACARLAEAATEFGCALEALRSGAPERGIPVPSGAARDHLAMVSRRWPAFVEAAATLCRNSATSAEITSARAYISVEADRLMVDADEVVARFDEQFAWRTRRLHRRMTAVGVAGGIALAGAYVALSATTRRRAERAEHEVALREHELEDRAEERRDLLRRLLAVSEDERRRIAADLHDGLTQELTGAAMLLESALQDGEAGGLARVATAHAYLNDAIEETRRIIADLRPPLLDDLGIAEALNRALRPAADDFGVEVVIDAALAARPDPRDALTLYRVAHEAVMNALRHSGADRVEVALSQQDGRFLLEVRDRGAGFDAASVANARAGYRPLGLLGMRERVEMAGGDLEVESAPGRGTVVRARIPAEAWTAPR